MFLYAVKSISPLPRLGPLIVVCIWVIFMNCYFTKSVLHLEYVVSGWYVCDVDPLAVDIGVIRVVAARTEALRKVLCKL